VKLLSPLKSCITKMSKVIRFSLGDYSFGNGLGSITPDS
jgi:hypothetical protein